MHFIYWTIDAITTPLRFFVYWISRALPGVRAIGRISLPMKWALISLFFLLCVFVSAIVKHWLEKPERGGIPLLQWLLALFLILIIPVLVYFFVKYLLMEEKSKYPEIDRVWNEGCQESEAKGILLSRTPLFLVLGVPKANDTNSLLKSSCIEFPVNQPTHGDSSISFHANSRAIFLFLNSCSCISKLSTTRGTSTPLSAGIDAHDGPLSEEIPGGTIDASLLRSDRQQQKNSDSSPRSDQPTSFTPGGTMMLEEGQDINELLNTFSTSKNLSSNEAAECEDRLRHVCKLIKKSRLPLCPVNGIVATIPFELVESSEGQLQIAAQKDLFVLRRELMVRCPLTVLITGLEREDGFVELMRRIPAEKLKENRFGKGSDPWVAPEVARLDAIGVHATASFEDWTYLLFQDRDALKRNNSELFTMLCRMRGVFAENLRKILARGFGFDPLVEPHLAFEQFLFGGCYFAATGSSQKEHAFVKSVFEKTIQQEGELEWSPYARRLDNQYYFFANLAALVGMIAILAIAGMLVHQFILNKM